MSYQDQANLYFQLINQGVGPDQAFQQAFPEGLQRAKQKDMAKAQNQGQMGAIGGTVAGIAGVAAGRSIIDGQVPFSETFKGIGNMFGGEAANQATQQVAQQTATQVAPTLAQNTGSLVNATAPAAQQAVTPIATQVATPVATTAAPTAVGTATNGGTLMSDGSVVAPESSTLGTLGTVAQGAAGAYGLYKGGEGVINAYEEGDPKSGAISGGIGGAGAAALMGSLGYTSTLAMLGGPVGLIAGGIALGLGAGLAGHKPKTEVEEKRLSKLQESGVQLLGPIIKENRNAKEQLRDNMNQYGVAKDYVGFTPDGKFVNNKWLSSGGDESTLTPVDVWGYSAFLEKFGNDYTKASEDQRYAIAKAALDKGLVSEGKGTIRLKDDASFDEYARGLLSGQIQDNAARASYDSWNQARQEATAGGASVPTSSNSPISPLVGALTQSAPPQSSSVPANQPIQTAGVAQAPGRRKWG